ncbi:histidine phosphatase family protein [Propioniciclava soli]|uniref:Histidine phosphatase family protein n=1 Tax=Propioniciclava soli TaxID=2775081 RepID=A0ABZ3C3D5_9ACTN
MKRVYLIRHGEAEFTGHGRGDHGRRLTEEGHEQARTLGELLAESGIQVVLTSTADRAAATASGLGLGEVRPIEELYNASTAALLRSLATLDDDVDTAAVVAHAPGIPALVDELSGDDPDPQAADLIRHHFGTATCAGIEFSGSWAHLDRPRLFWAARG